MDAYAQQATASSSFQKDYTKWTEQSGGLPGDLLETVKAVHDRLQQSANDKIKQAQEEYQALATELRQQLNQAELTIQQLQTQQSDLAKSIETLRGENDVLRTDSEAERIKTAKLEAALSESTDRLVEAKATIKEQKQETSQIRAHFEHYQTSVAEDRQQEREQYRSIKTQLDGRIQELSQQLKDEAGRSQIIEAANQKTERTVAHLRTECEQAKQDYQDVKLEATRKDEVVKHLESEAEILREQAVKREARGDVILKENTQLTAANQLLEQDSTRLNQQVSEASDKITLLTDENRIVAQEKAVLQGQLKQIQSSL